MSLRLTAVEVAELDRNAAASGAESRCEFIRLLLHRESNRRKGRGKPAASDYQTQFRKGGRPFAEPAIFPKTMRPAWEHNKPSAKNESKKQ